MKSLIRGALLGVLLVLAACAPPCDSGDQACVLANAYELRWLLNHSAPNAMRCSTMDNNVVCNSF